MTLKLSTGILSGVDHVDFNYRNLALQSTAIISSGNSGSPLLSKDSLQIVGMNYAKNPSESQINYAVPLWRLRQVLAKHKKVHAGTTELPAKPHQFHLIDPKITITPGLPAFYARANGCNSGALISDVVPKSMFLRAQPPVKRDDFLVAVNGINLDRYGQGVSKSYVDERVDYTDLMWMREGTGEEDISVTVCDSSTGRQTDHKMNMAWTQENDGSTVRWVYEPRNEGVDWEIFG